MEFDDARFAELVLYVCERAGPKNVGAVKLNKVFYYADMMHFVQHGTPLVGAHYIKLQHGPACRELPMMITRLKQRGDLTEQEVEYFGYFRRQFTPARPADLSTLRAEEKQLLDEIVDFVCLQHTAKEISELSHATPWEITEYNEEIPYSSAFWLFLGEMTSDAMDWAQDEVLDIEKTRQGASSVAFSDFRDFRSRIAPQA